MPPRDLVQVERDGGGAGRRGGRPPLWAGLAVLLVLAVVLTSVAATTSVLPPPVRRLILGGGAGAPAPSRGASGAGSPVVAVAPPPGARAVPALDPAAAPGGGRIDVPAISARVVPTTVDILVHLAYDGGLADGTGIVLDSSGLVLTDEHVIFEADRISARVAGRDPTYQAAVIGADPSDDVALIQLEHASGLAPAPLGDPQTASLGDRVVVVGNADGNGPSASGGRLTSLGEDFPVSPDGDWPGAVVSNMLATSANVEPGQSGGPLVDAEGRTIGLLESADDQGTGYATPMDQAIGIARQIAAGQAGPYVVIGLPAVLGAVTRDAGRGRQGARVTDVHAGTPAAALGLRPGDVITRVDATDVTTSLVLARTLVRYRPGDRVRLTWEDRFGGTRSASTTLIAGPAP